jgi:hypothetical protein
MDEVEITVRVGVRTRIEAIGDSLLVGGVRIQFTDEAGPAGRIAKVGALAAELAVVRRTAEDELRRSLSTWAPGELVEAFGS